MWQGALCPLSGDIRANSGDIRSNSGSIWERFGRDPPPPPPHHTFFFVVVVLLCLSKYFFPAVPFVRPHPYPDSGIAEYYHFGRADKRRVHETSSGDIIQLTNWIL